MDIDNYDKVVTHANGDKEFYLLLHVAGIDEDGFYQVVLEGPAEGERAYE